MNPALDAYMDARASLTELMADEVVVSMAFLHIWSGRVDWRMETSRVRTSGPRTPMTDVRLKEISANNEAKVDDAFDDAYEIVRRSAGIDDESGWV